MANILSAGTILAVSAYEQEQTFKEKAGEAVNAEIRFDAVNYDRYVIASAFGSGPFEGDPGAHGGVGEFGGVIVERLDGGNRKMANQSVEANASSITFFASVSEGFFIPKNTGRQLTYRLELQGATKKFLPATLVVKHATLNLT